MSAIILPHCHSADASVHSDTRKGEIAGGSQVRTTMLAAWQRKRPLAGIEQNADTLWTVLFSRAPLTLDAALHRVA